MSEPTNSTLRSRRSRQSRRSGRSEPRSIVATGDGHLPSNPDPALEDSVQTLSTMRRNRTLAQAQANIPLPMQLDGWWLRLCNSVPSLRTFVIAWK